MVRDSQRGRFFWETYHNFDWCIIVEIAQLVRFLDGTCPGFKSSTSTFLVVEAAHTGFNSST
jgi:hypothetical protein